MCHIGWAIFEGEDQFCDPHRAGGRRNEGGGSVIGVVKVLSSEKYRIYRSCCLIPWESVPKICLLRGTPRGQSEPKPPAGSIGTLSLDGPPERPRGDWLVSGLPVKAGSPTDASRD